MEPEPLPIGCLLENRFEVSQLIGRGSFCLTYACFDRKRDDACVVKELCPPNSTRHADGVLEIKGGPKLVGRLRRRFLEEARSIGMVQTPGIPKFRGCFTCNGTAYAVVVAIKDAVSLDQTIATKGPLSEGDCEEVFRRLLETLAIVHASGILHRNIKPSNVLLSPKGVFLTDFGGAREWYYELGLAERDVLSPIFSPPEQFSDRARRGPASDFFSLCATIYASAAGIPPASSSGIEAGAGYVPIAELRPSLSERMAAAIDWGLRTRYTERPHDANSLLRLLDGVAHSEEVDNPVERMDDQAKALKSLQFHRRQCPSCLTGVLEQPRPLKSKQCPVCHAGQIRIRKIDPQLCPNCRQAPLKLRKNVFPTPVCPICQSAVLDNRRVSLLRKDRRSVCPDCDSQFESKNGLWAVVSMRGEPVPVDDLEYLSEIEWRMRAGRSEHLFVCAGCSAQYDLLSDQRLRQMAPFRTGRYETLYPDEWSNVAAGLPPFAGNAECEGCGADYFLDGDRITLLQYESDPFDVGDSMAGRLLDVDSLRWLGVGKESTQDGLVCADCAAEFDFLGENLELVKCSNVRLLDRSSEPRTIEDWIRIGRGLPTVSEEPAFEREFDECIRLAYRSSRIGLDHGKRKELIWTGPAEVGTWNSEGFDGQQSAQLTIEGEHVLFGGKLRKAKYSLSEAKLKRWSGDLIEWTVDGEVLAFRIDPIEWTCHLASGSRRIELGAEDLALRLSSH